MTRPSQKVLLIALELRVVYIPYRICQRDESSTHSTSPITQVKRVKDDSVQIQ